MVIVDKNLDLTNNLDLDICYKDKGKQRFSEMPEIMFFLYILREIIR